MNLNLKKILERLKSIFRLSSKKTSIQSENSYQEKGELDKKLVFGMAKSRVPSLSQWKYLKKSLSSRERFILNFSISILILSLFFLGLRFIQRHTVFLPKEGGRYVEGMIGAPHYVNPIFSQTNDVDSDLSKLIFSSLMKFNKNSELVGDLVESYELSEDQKVYTFHIKKDVKWHDNEILNVNDILFTIETIIDPEFKSPLYLNLKGVETEKIDDYTFKLILKEPFSPFITTLTFGIFPLHLYGDVPPENISLVEYNLKPIGSGPFKFKSLTRDNFGNIKAYTLERNGDYYGKIPYIENLVFRFYPDIIAAIESLKNKNIEGLSYISKEYEKELPQKLKINYYHLRMPQYTAVFYNTKNAVLKDKNVRLALTHATNRQEIIDKVLFGEAEESHGPILDGFLGFNPELKKINYNPEEARKILEEADWKIPENEQFRKKGDQELKFTLTTIDQQDFVKTTEMLKSFWAQIGVNVELRIIDSERIQKEVIKPRDYDSIIYGQIVGFDPDPYPFWHSSQQRDPGLNLAIYYKKEIDKVLEQARKTSDLEERTKKYVEFQNILADEMPALFLHSPGYTYGLNKKVKGFDLKIITSPQDRFISVEDWYINSKRVWQ